MKSLNKYYLLFILLAGIIVRIYFFTGHIFSDDAYYSYLSYTLLDGNFANGYLGYPLFLLRVGHLFLTAVSFAIFGINEFATIVFPFLISILNLLLTYKIAQLFTGKNEIALLSALIMAFFPTDIVFATINFVDAQNIFFINMGLYFLYKSYKSERTVEAVTGGLFIFLSMQIKENVVYTSILLLGLWLYLLIKRKGINPQIVIALGFVILNFLIEGFIYLIVHHDFLYRLTIFNRNYLFCYYDFFPYTAQQFSGVKNYWRNLFDQILLLNIKSVFLRRFYLFLPLVALVQSYVLVSKNKTLLLTHWFTGTAFLMIFVSTSFTEYKPLDLQRSWYIFPLLMPMIILSASLIFSLRKRYSLILVGMYIIGSVVMSTHYQAYFNNHDKAGLKSFLKENMQTKIFTDHFTKYGVDLIRNYLDLSKTARIDGRNFDWEKINPGEWVLFNPVNIEELKLQKFTFPDFSILGTKTFSKIKSFGDFYIYEKRK